MCCSGGVEWGLRISHNGMNGEVVIFNDTLLDHKQSVVDAKLSVYISGNTANRHDML